MKRSVVLALLVAAGCHPVRVPTDIMYNAPAFSAGTAVAVVAEALEAEGFEVAAESSEPGVVATAWEVGGSSFRLQRSNGVSTYESFRSSSRLKFTVASDPPLIHVSSEVRHQVESSSGDSDRVYEIEGTLAGGAKRAVAAVTKRLGIPGRSPGEPGGRSEVAGVGY